MPPPSANGKVAEMRVLKTTVASAIIARFSCSRVAAGGGTPSQGPALTTVMRP